MQTPAPPHTPSADTTASIASHPGTPVEQARALAAIDAWVDDHFDEEVRLLQALVQIPTDTPPGNNAPHAHHVAKYLETLGWAVEQHPVPDGVVRDHGLESITNLIVRRPYGPGGPVVALNAHGDVVPPGEGWRFPPYGGVIDGVRVQLTLVPKKKIGIAVLCNLHRTYMTQALTNSLLDHFRAAPKTDWNAHVQTVVRKYEEQAAENLKKEIAKRHNDTKPSRELSAYAGNYEHAAYGTVRVALERGQLVWTWNRLGGPLEHFHYDTFVLRDDVLQEPFVQFVLDTDGKVAVLKVAGALGVEFKRKDK